MRTLHPKAIYTSSGTRGFHGEGYWWHWFAKIFLLYFGCGFVTKTVTRNELKGNMKLRANGTPAHWFPDCIRVDLWFRLALNAVGLSNLGFDWLMKELLSRVWKKGELTISLTAVGDQGIVEKAAEVLYMIRKINDSPLAEVANIEVNLGCPNTGEGLDSFIALMRLIFNGVEDTVETPLIINVGPTANAEAIADLAQHACCAAVSVCNTLPHNEAPLWLQRIMPPMPREYAPTGGGISGWVLLPYTANLVCRLRTLGVTKPIIAGGGITRQCDIDILKAAGADAVKISTVSMFAPWKTPLLIWHAHRVFGKGTR